jgi:hypothetical protein
MESNSQLPYELFQEGLTYYFVNKHGIKYRAYFADISVYYPQFPHTYSFSFEPENSSRHPIDNRISATIAEILKQFFAKEENAMIMVCDSLDGKEQKRRKLFDRWFEKYADDSILKYDASAPLEDYQLFISLYFKKTNPNKELLLQSFFELLKTDLYQIGF